MRGFGDEPKGGTSDRSSTTAVYFALLVVVILSAALLVGSHALDTIGGVRTRIRVESG